MSYQTQTDADRRPSAHRSFLPRRSRGDRKLAGVAGGLGRALGIDPVLIRVAFVVLAIFGGAGVLLYCLGWLLMPADGDEVSAIEALAGRGQSSVSTALTVVLIIVGLSSAGSVFSWGLPFWPVLIAAVVVFALVRHGRMGSCRGRSDWGARAGEFADRAAAWGARAGEWGNRAGEWGTRAGEWARRGGDGRSEGWAGGAQGRQAGAGSGSGSPFGRPAFWEEGGTPATGWAPPDPATRQSAATGPDGAPRPDARTQAAPADSGSTASASTASPTGSGPAAPPPPTEPPSPQDLLTGGRTTPPAWDPLGVAPFAWDLPDPTVEPEPATTGPTPGRGAVGRVFLGLALVTGGLLAGGVFAGWWGLSWAAVAGITLAVLGLGLLISSLRGTGGRGLIGPGVFLSLVTLALAVTGISGTTDYGQRTWSPTSVAAVDGQSFHWNAGQATLDLSGLAIPKGQIVTTDLIVNGGQATIIVPKGVTVDATCSANAGQVDCLGTRQNGLRPEATGHQTGDAGTLKVEVRSNAGQAEVINHG